MKFSYYIQSVVKSHFLVKKNNKKYIYIIKKNNTSSTEFVQRVHRVSALHFIYRFATQQRNGLLFYNGRFNEKHDFIALEIVDGQVQFSFSLGAHITKVSPYIQGGVNDGSWHQVTVAYLNGVRFYFFRIIC